MGKIVITVMILWTASMSYSQDINSYLILQDIGNYKKLTQGGPSGNILAGGGHFGLDHKDRSFGIVYVNDEHKMWVDVQVVEHSGSDSDRWLLHELDAEFRNYYGIPGDSYAAVKIDGNTIFEFGSGGWDYRWLSGNKVIMIEYTDLQMTKPEPIEIVKAYLAKHPSTLPPMTLADLRSSEFKTKWIKDEMERRLWLCDKWFVQLESDRSKLNQILKTVVDYMVLFLNYREKYFGVQGRDEKIALTGYLSTKNESAIKSKLTEYKNWWNSNKTKSISLP